MEAAELCAELNDVTIRYPFGDVDFWEFFLSLRAEVKFPDLRSKTLVRKLMRGKLPDVILDQRNKTLFNDYAMSRVDYAKLRQLLVNSNHRIDGVDYRRLAVHLEREDLKLLDMFWVHDLARIHAFLSLWEAPSLRPQVYQSTLSTPLTPTSQTIPPALGPPGS